MIVCQWFNIAIHHVALTLIMNLKQRHYSLGPLLLILIFHRAEQRWLSAPTKPLSPSLQQMLPEGVIPQWPTCSWRSHPLDKGLQLFVTTKLTTPPVARGNICHIDFSLGCHRQSGDWTHCRLCLAPSVCSAWCTVASNHQKRIHQWQQCSLSYGCSRPLGWYYW